MMDCSPIEPNEAACLKICREQLEEFLIDTKVYNLKSVTEIVNRTLLSKNLAPKEDGDVLKLIISWFPSVTVSSKKKKPGSRGDKRVLVDEILICWPKTLHSLMKNSVDDTITRKINSMCKLVRAEMKNVEFEFVGEFSEDVLKEQTAPDLLLKLCNGLINGTTETPYTKDAESISSVILFNYRRKDYNEVNALHINC